MEGIVMFYGLCVLALGLLRRHGSSSTRDERDRSDEEEPLPSHQISIETAAIQTLLNTGDDAAALAALHALAEVGGPRALRAIQQRPTTLFESSRLRRASRSAIERIQARARLAEGALSHPRQDVGALGLHDDDDRSDHP